MKPTPSKNLSKENLLKVIEALMDENDKLREEVTLLKKEKANNKMESPSPTVLRALALYGD
jgi:hypothetical protein